MQNFKQKENHLEPNYTTQSPKTPFQILYPNLCGSTSYYMTNLALILKQETHVHKKPKFDNDEKKGAAIHRIHSATHTTKFQIPKPTKKNSHYNQRSSFRSKRKKEKNGIMKTKN